MEMVSSMQPMKILTTHFSSSCAPHFIILAVCVVVVVPIMTMSMLKCLVSPSSQRKPKKNPLLVHFTIIQNYNLVDIIITIIINAVQNSYEH